MDFIPPWLSPLAAALAGALSIWNFIQSPSRKNESSINDLRRDLGSTREKLEETVRSVADEVDEVAGRVSTLETIMQSLPDKDSLHRLEVTLTSLSGQIETLNVRIGPIDNLSRRLQEVLLERANDR